MNRLTAMQHVLNHFPEQPVVSNCGATSRELASLGQQPNHLYLLDSMGMASSVGLGLALALHESTLERVVVFEGDGSLLMNLGSLASIAYHAPAPLLLVLLDNQSYASTGGQPTYSERVDLSALARATGLTTLTAVDETSLKSHLTEIPNLPGPIFLHIIISPGNTADIELLLEDPAVIGSRFSNWITSQLD